MCVLIPAGARLTADCRTCPYAAHCIDCIVDGDTHAE